jgi:hypothetical protein
MNDPYAVPVNRPQSPAPLVAGIREHVDAWRRDGYPGSSATTRRLLEHWFLDEHQTPDGRPFRYFFTQREATETLIYLYEVAKQRTLASMAAQFASRPIAVSGQQYPRYVVKAATGSGKTKVMSLLIAWSYFHRLREADSELTTNSLIVAPNLIVFERLRADFEHGAIFYNDPVLPPEWRGDFNLAVCLRDEPLPVAARGVLVLSNIQALYERQVLEPANPIDALLGASPPRNWTFPQPPAIRRVGCSTRWWSTIRFPRQSTMASSNVPSSGSSRVSLKPQAITRRCGIGSASTPESPSGENSGIPSLPPAVSHCCS